MRDFIHAHRKEDQPPPKLTSTLKPETPIISAAKNISETQKQRRLEWEKDFGQPAEIESKNKGKKKQSPVKPDWMKDFE